MATLTQGAEWALWKVKDYWEDGSTDFYLGILEDPCAYYECGLDEEEDAQEIAEAIEWLRFLKKEEEEAKK